MRNFRWIHAAFVGAALFGTTPLVHAQTGTTTGTTSSSTAGSTSMGSSSSLGPSLSAGSTTGTAGQGIATLSGTGGTGGGKGGGAGSSAATAIPAASDRFSGTYANPLYMGISGVSTTFTASGTAASGSASQTYFGKALYATTTTTGNTGATSSSILNINQGGFSTIGMSRAPAYRTVLGSGVPLARPAGAELQGVILSSLAASPLKDKNGILLKVDGSTVFLKGQVADDSERRIIEGFVRMTPGVRDVVNELVPLATASNE